jgi:PAS domain S-box-containing protein
MNAQKRMETDLRESEERFRGAFEFAAIGMALVAPDGRWLRVNRSLCGIVGYTADELLTRDFQSITYEEDLDTDVGHMRQMLDGSLSHYDMEKRYLHKDGHIVWVLLSVSLVRDAQGQALAGHWCKACAKLPTSPPPADAHPLTSRRSRTRRLRCLTNPETNCIESPKRRSTMHSGTRTQTILKSRSKSIWH